MLDKSYNKKVKASFKYPTACGQNRIIDSLGILLCKHTSYNRAMLYTFLTSF